MELSQLWHMTTLDYGHTHLYQSHLPGEKSLEVMINIEDPKPGVHPAHKENMLD